ncbi:hypothetical protein VNO78_22692 [Psophocarpus tetragonolobus]|uniref:Uncharacterized protein n=1 Tax=Psophocarpus tetragonolobus TaxID=3891 RepID=A0AAN9S562_PSOTE
MSGKRQGGLHGGLEGSFFPVELDEVKEFEGCYVRRVHAVDVGFEWSKLYRAVHESGKLEYLDAEINTIYDDVGGVSKDQKEVLVEKEWNQREDSNESSRDIMFSSNGHQVGNVEVSGWDVERGVVGRGVHTTEVIIMEEAGRYEKGHREGMQIVSIKEASLLDSEGTKGVQQKTEVGMKVFLRRGRGKDAGWHGIRVKKGENKEGGGVLSGGWERSDQAVELDVTKFLLPCCIVEGNDMLESSGAYSPRLSVHELEGTWHWHYSVNYIDAKTHDCEGEKACGSRDWNDKENNNLEGQRRCLKQGRWQKECVR